MTGRTIRLAFGAVLILAGAPAAVVVGASGAAAQTSPGLATGRSVSKAHHRAKRTSPGSYTNGKPDGANTGSRKQSPTGGNPGDGNHS